MSAGGELRPYKRRVYGHYEGRPTLYCGHPYCMQDRFFGEEPEVNEPHAWTPGHRDWMFDRGA